jgi:hypothetical protein
MYSLRLRLPSVMITESTTNTFKSELERGSVAQSVSLLCTADSGDDHVYGRGI